MLVREMALLLRDVVKGVVVLASKPV